MLETLLGDRKIDNRRFRGQLGGKTRVRKPARHKKLEITIILYRLPPDVYKFRLSLHNNLLFQHRVQHRVYFVFYILYNQTHALFHAIFQEIVLKFRMRDRRNGTRRVDEFREFILYPYTALGLRVNEHRETRGIGDHNTVLDG